MVSFKSILRVLLSLIILFGISLGFNPIQKTEAQTGTAISSCGAISVSGNYYLNQDLSCPGNGLAINADGISLNLNGHTLTYNTSSQGAPVYGIVLAPSGWQNLTSLHLTNGTITQGAGKTTAGHALYFHNGNISGVELDHLSINVSGKDSKGIHFDWGSNTNIHDNTINSTITEITNRAQFDGYAILHSDGDHLNIYGNTIRGGQGGIAITGNSSNINIYNNDISHKALGTNGYAVMISGYGSLPIHDVKVYNNNIHTTDGTGIEIDNNYRNIEVYANTIDVKFGPKSEYGYSYVAWGIKCRSENVAGAGGLKVHDNNIKAATGEGLVYGAAGIGIYDDTTGLNNEYYNNIINASLIPPPSGTLSSEYYAAGIIDGGISASAPGTRIYNNTITSNHRNIEFSFHDGVGANDFNFISNTLVKDSSVLSSHPCHTIKTGYWIYATQNHTFLDTKTLNGADIDDVAFGSLSGGANYSLYVKWYLDVLVKNAAGQAIPAANISATATGGGTDNPSATTGTDGRARLELTEYYRYGTTYPPTSNYTQYSPYNLTVSASGYSNKTYPNFVINTSKEMAVVMAGTDGPIISNVVANVDQTAKTAVITWNTSSSVASSVEYGPLLLTAPINRAALGLLTAQP